MKSWACALLLVLFSQNALASILPFSGCSSSNRFHTLKLQQTGTDVLLTFANKRFVKYQDIRHKEEGTLKISGMDTSQIKVADTNLHNLLKTRYLLRELVVASMLGRPDYDGEADMVYSDASSLIHDLYCK